MVAFMVVFQVEVTPIGKPRMTKRDKWTKRDCVDRYYSFKDSIRQEAKKQKFELSDSFTIKFYVPMPKSWSKKKREAMFFKPHTQKPDIDNMLKAVMDSLLVDDSSVHTVKMTKMWSIIGEIHIKNDEQV